MQKWNPSASWVTSTTPPNSMTLDSAPLGATRGMPQVADAPCASAYPSLITPQVASLPQDPKKPPQIGTPRISQPPSRRFIHGRGNKRGRHPDPRPQDQYQHRSERGFNGPVLPSLAKCRPRFHQLQPHQPCLYPTGEPRDFEPTLLQSQRPSQNHPQLLNPTNFTPRWGAIPQPLSRPSTMPVASRCFPPCSSWSTHNPAISRSSRSDRPLVYPEKCSPSPFSKWTSF